MDRGIEPLQEALSKDSRIDATAARAYEQACARRAALRNPKYVEKTAHEHSGEMKHSLCLEVPPLPYETDKPTR